MSGEVIRSAAIGLDVGGTHVQAGAVVTDGNSTQVNGEARSIPSPSQKSSLEIIQEIGNLIVRVKNSAEQNGLQVEVCGIGMPGPFDYKNGISKMTGENAKFAAAYDQDFKTPFQEMSGLPVFFVGDAEAYGLGVIAKEFPNEARLLAIPIGTGLGGAFIVDGKIREELPEVTQSQIPPDGIWNIKYQGQNFEEAVSKRAIERGFRDLTGISAEVVEIAAAGRTPDGLEARSVFRKFGRDLGYGLQEVLSDFKPTRIAIGGNISKASDLFIETLISALEDQGHGDIPISVLNDDDYTVIGAAQYALNQLQK
ncbi:MAG TPA: ROK family protein [Patescibacteria group bacterium]|nr:ROK family protein [Patescibacteria group bacterium]